MIRRLAPALLFLVMVNVTALGSGLFSLWSGTSTERALATPDMPGMDMHRAPDRGHGRGDDRCPLPWSPGCASIGPCSPVALIASAPVELRQVMTVGAPVAAVSMAPASVDEAPDHPPPRG